MGIYRTLLEEEIPHLDDNNNPDDQIQELQDVIEDSDANEAEQQAAQDAAFGPDCGVDDIMAENAIAIYEFEAGHSDILRAIGMHELQEAASGREFIMEAADIKGFFKSIKDKVVAFFKKVWQVLQRWAGNIKAVFTSNKKFADKYASAMKEGYAALQKKGNNKMKMYSFAGVDDAVKHANDNKKNKIDDDFDTLSNAIKSASGYSKNVTEEVKNKFSAEALEEGLDKGRASLCGKGENEKVSAADFSSELKKYLYGSEDPKEGLMPVDQIIAVMTGKKNDVKAVKDFTDNAKKQFKSVMDKLNTLEKSASKIDDGQGINRNNIMALITRLTTMQRSMLTATQTWRSATLSAINARSRQARRYGMAYVAASNRAKHKGFQKESTEYGFLGNLGLV